MTLILQNHTPKLWKFWSGFQKPSMAKKYHGQGLPSLASSTVGAEQKARNVCYRQEDLGIDVMLSI